MYIYRLECPNSLLRKFDGRFLSEKLKPIKILALDQLPLGSKMVGDNSNLFHIPYYVKQGFDLKGELQGAKIVFVSSVLLENLTKVKKELLEKLESLMEYSYNESLCRVIFDTICDINHQIDDEEIEVSRK